MRFIISLIFALVSTVAHADLVQLPPLNMGACKQLLPYGVPTHAFKYYTTICRHAYVLDYSLVNRTPIWVAYILRPEYTVGCLKRAGSFTVDRSLMKMHRSSPEDYVGSGYDMGHMVGVGDMSWDELVMQETYIMTNITPQLPGFNRGIWKQLEDQTRAWAQERRHELLIYLGTVYYGDEPILIGKNNIAVPSAFFKVIIDTVTNEVMAFIFVHTPIRASLELFMVDADVVEQRTGVKLPLPSEYKSSTSLWASKLKSTRIARTIRCAAETE